MSADEQLAELSRLQAEGAFVEVEAMESMIPRILELWEESRQNPITRHYRFRTRIARGSARWPPFAAAESLPPDIEVVLPTWLVRDEAEFILRRTLREQGVPLP
jgi:hypothetical protein